MIGSKYIKYFIACFVIGAGSFLVQETMGMKQNQSKQYVLKMKDATGKEVNYLYSVPEGERGYFDGKRMLVVSSNVGYAYGNNVGDVFLDVGGNIYIGDKQIINSDLSSEYVTHKNPATGAFCKVKSQAVGSLSNEICGNGIITFKNIVKNLLSNALLGKNDRGYFDGKRMLVVSSNVGYAYGNNVGDVFLDVGGNIYIGDKQIINSDLSSEYVTHKNPATGAFCKVKSQAVGSLSNEICGNGIITFKNIVKNLKKFDESAVISRNQGAVRSFDGSGSLNVDKKTVKEKTTDGGINNPTNSIGWGRPSAPLEQIPGLVNASLK